MKTLILTIALLSAPIFLFSQGLGLGVKLGANFANVNTDNYDVKSKTSYHAGAYANIGFSEKWGVTGEVLWSAQGAELDDVEFNTNYIAVPIMLRWHVIDLISLEAGPVFNFLTSAEYGGNDFKDQLNDPSYSGAFGALVHLPLGFNGGVRYVLGLSDLTEDDTTEVKDATFQVYVGWTILGAK